MRSQESTSERFPPALVLVRLQLAAVARQFGQDLPISALSGGRKEGTGGLAWPITCVVLRGYACAIERAAGFFQLPLNALHSACANSAFACDLEYALTGPQVALDSFFDGRANLWPAEALIANAAHGPNRNPASAPEADLITSKPGSVHPASSSDFVFAPLFLLVLRRSPPA